MINISDIAKQTKTATGTVAENIFSNAVEDFIRGRLETPRPGGKLPPRAPQPLNVWAATSYAAALAGPTSYRPKLKFLFKIEFKFKEGVLQDLQNTGLISDSVKNSLEKNEFTFMVKTVDRPKVDFEYEEDVNMYNFRTKVLKKIRHRELTVAFMDDTGNRVFNFFRTMMMIYSPIVRRQVLRDAGPGSSKEPPNDKTIFPGNGMSFLSPSPDRVNIAHRGVINTDIGNALSYIRVKQIFVDASSPTIQNAAKEVTFDFMNPRIVSFDLDEMSHEASDPNILTMQFDYDWMEMVDSGPLAGPTLPDYSSIRSYGAQTAPSDVSAVPGAPSAAGGIVGSSVNNLLSNVTQNLTSKLVNKAVRSIPGGGRFAQVIGARAAHTLGGITGSAVSGLINAAGRQLVTTGSQALARPTSSAVVDSGRLGPQQVSAFVTSSDAEQTTNPARR